jgi:hypothetical protein
MLTHPANRSFGFLGLLMVFTLCFLTADLEKAEGVTGSGDLPSEAKFSCMIGKSAYGSPGFDEPIRRLHRFRDQVLMASPFGRWMTKGYYRLSNSLAPSLDGDGLTGGGLRWTIRALLYLVKHLEAVGLGTWFVVITLVFGKRRIRAFKASFFSPRWSQSAS